jgi:hypothetical protein
MISNLQMVANNGERLEEEQEKKSRKRARTKELPMLFESEAALQPHTQAASSLAWPHPLALYSASWDASVRHYDVVSNSVGRRLR